MNIEEIIKKNVPKPNFTELASVMALDTEPFKLAELRKVCTKIINAKSIYQVIEKATGVPWNFTGCLHFMEASLRFEACLHNGQPWNKVTTIVPKGRGPWKSFEEAAIDALKYDKLANKPEGYWTVARMLEFAFNYNGTGYSKKGILSPYVFSYTNLSSEIGKYVADHVYDANAPHNRPSVGAILLMLKQMEESAVARVSTDQFLRNELVNLWQRDLGEREVNGPNRSKMIDEINKRLRVGLGSPYCIGGLLVRGVEVLCTKYALKNPVVMTAGTQNFFAKAKFKNLAAANVKARKSDICILQNKADKNHGHAYGLTIDEEASQQRTIEYNTNVKGSRDGDGVHELVRTRAGTDTKTYLGSVDVVAWILSENQDFKIV